MDHEQRGSEHEGRRSGPATHQVILKQQVGCFDARALAVNLVVYTGVLLLARGLFRPGFHFSGIVAVLEAAILMSALNILLKTVLVFLTLPLNVMTFGLFSMVVNVIVLYGASFIMGRAFVISSLPAAIMASAVISVLRMGINHFIFKDDRLKIS